MIFLSTFQSCLMSLSGIPPPPVFTKANDFHLSQEERGLSLIVQDRVKTSNNLLQPDPEKLSTLCICDDTAAAQPQELSLCWHNNTYPGQSVQYRSVKEAKGWACMWTTGHWSDLQLHRSGIWHCLFTHEPIILASSTQQARCFHALNSIFTAWQSVVDSDVHILPLFFQRYFFGENLLSNKCWTSITVSISIFCDNNNNNNNIGI